MDSFTLIASKILLFFGILVLLPLGIFLFFAIRGIIKNRHIKILPLSPSVFHEHPGLFCEQDTSQRKQEQKAMLEYLSTCYTVIPSELLNLYSTDLFFYRNFYFSSMEDTQWYIDTFSGKCNQSAPEKIIFAADGSGNEYFVYVHESIVGSPVYFFDHELKEDIRLTNTISDFFAMKKVVRI